MGDLPKGRQASLIIKKSMKNKKLFIYLIIVVVASFLAAGLIWYFSQRPETGEISIPEKSERDKIIEQQLKELEQLRRETLPLTDEEARNQLEELKKLRQGTKPLSQEEIQKQLEELKKLRAQ